MSITKPTLTGLSRTKPSAPSDSLLRAALSGLLAVGAAACGGDADSKSDDKDHEHDDELDDAELDAVCKDKVDKALEAQDLDKVCADSVKAAKDACDSAADTMCMSDLDKAKMQVSSLTEACRPLVATTEEKTTDSEQKEYTFAQLTKMCDDRGGYTQIGAACGGHNACKGFAYGDWGPGAATLTEHTCAGTNGCLGVYCTETAKDQGRSPKDLYEMDFGDPGPHKCTSCHAEHNAAGDEDASKFLVWVYDPANSPYSGPERNLDNWKTTHTVAQAERIVAFGVHGVLPDGTAYNSMAPYFQVMSRNEIANLVKYVRDELTPVLQKVKTKDP